MTSSADEKAWFGAETLIARCIGTAEAPRLVERRVVLLRAASMEEAVTLGFAEGEQYAEELSWPNEDGEMVSGVCLGCNVFDIREDPGERIEVFSSIVLIEEPVDNDSLVDRFHGAERRDEAVWRRFEPDFDRAAELAEKQREESNQ